MADVLDKISQVIQRVRKLERHALEAASTCRYADRRERAAARAKAYAIVRKHLERIL